MSSSYLSPVGTIIGVTGKVVYLRCAAVCCMSFVVSASLSCSFPFVLVGTWPDDCPVGIRVVGECFVVFLAHLSRRLTGELIG